MSFALRKHEEGGGYNVLVDGVDIANHVSSLKIEGSSTGEPFTVTLELLIFPGEIDLPDAVLKAIQIPFDQEDQSNKGEPTA